MLCCILKVTEIVESGSQIKVALRRLVIDFQGLQVALDTVFELVLHVERITQVVKGRGILRIQVNCSLVGLDCGHVIIFNAQSISQIVERLCLLGVKLDSSLVVFDCIVDFFNQVKGVTQVVVHIREKVVLSQSFLVVAHRCLGLTGVIISITETN
jgi:hypothetical protein